MKTLGDTLPRRFKAKASGSITAGKPLIVEADGDVAQVTLSRSVLSTPSLGTAAEFTGNTGGGKPFIQTVYDANADKFLVFYQERDPFLLQYLKHYILLTSGPHQLAMPSPIEHLLYFS